MALDNQLDEQAADFRDMASVAPPNPPASSTPDSHRSNPLGRSLTPAQITAIVVTTIILGVVAYLTIGRQAFSSKAIIRSAPTYQPICPNGQKLTPGQSCPPDSLNK